MSNTIVQTGMERLMFARKFTLALLEGISEDQRAHAPCSSANPSAWILGHLCWTDDHFSSTLGQQPSQIPDDWAATFGMKSTPSTTPDAYPTLKELSEVLGTTRTKLIDWINSLSTEQLAAPLPDNLSGFASNYANLVSTIAWHEGMHAGQLTVVRKSLGLDPVFA